MSLIGIISTLKLLDFLIKTGFQNQKILSIARDCRVGEVKAACDDDGLVNHHHFVVGDGVITVFTHLNVCFSEQVNHISIGALALFVQQHTHRHAAPMCPHQHGTGR